MPATTYTSLVEDMKNYQQRSSTTDTRYHNQIPRLIQKAIERLGAEATTLINRVPIQDALQAGLPVLTKPTYWQNTISMMIAIGTDFKTIRPLFPRTKEFIQTYWEEPLQRDVPKYYGDYDQDHWIICPTPNAAYPVEYVVDLQAEPLSEENQTNFWTEKAPNLLLDACMLEAAIFLNPDSPAKIKTRQDIYDRTLQSYGVQKGEQATDRTERADR